MHFVGPTSSVGQAAGASHPSQPARLSDKLHCFCLESRSIKSYLTIHHSPDLQRVGILKFIRQSGIRPLLIADRSNKAKGGSRADGCRTTVRSGGGRTTLLLLPASFESPGEPSKKKTT